MSTPADVPYAKPGYRYGVAAHGTGEMKEVEPPCSCPCHVADAPCPSSWWCDKCCKGLMSFTSRPDAERVPYSHEQAVADGTANPKPYLVNVRDYFFLTCGNNCDDAFPHRHFETFKAAKTAADAINAEDVLASLDLTPPFIARRERLKKLGETFWVRYGEGHHEARWPEKPGRYAVREWSDRYSESFWTTEETIDGVRGLIEGGDVDCVVDLDTGEDVPFSLKVEIEGATA